MLLYTRHQLLLLLMILAATAAGLAVREWRATHSELAARLERFDHDPRPAIDPVPSTTDRERPLVPPPQDGILEPDGSPAAPRLADIGDPVDLNRATVQDLTRLPGVGPVLAARILEARQSAGRFDSVESLRNIRGLGGFRLERLRPLVTVVTP